MNHHSKNITSNSRSEIMRIKGYIRDSKRGFDGYGYAFKQAVREIRREGHTVIYDRAKCLYFFIEKLD